MALIHTDGSFLFSRETYEIIGACMKIHRKLGHGFLEIVYKDAIEVELANRRIQFQREKAYSVLYEGVVLPHRFYADFIILDKIVLEVKAASGGISPADISQVINYLKVSGCRVGLLINFGREKLEYHRFIL